MEDHPVPEAENLIKTGTAAEEILSKFFDALAAVEDLAEIAPRLRATVG